MRKPGLEKEHFEQQFHNQDHYKDDTTGTITPWWEQSGPGAYAKGGPVVDRALKITKKAIKGN